MLINKKLFIKNYNIIELLISKIIILTNKNIFISNKMKKIVFMFLFASYLSLNDIMTLEVIELIELKIENLTKENVALCVNTSLFNNDTNIYFSLQSEYGEMNSEIYYKSVELCPNTSEFNKDDNTLKTLKPTIQVTKEKQKSKFFYEYTIPKKDDKIWYMIIYTGFKGKTMIASFRPFSSKFFLIALLIVIGFIILIIVIIFIYCFCGCCKKKQKGIIFSPQNDNFVNDSIN